MSKLTPLVPSGNFWIGPWGNLGNTNAHYKFCWIFVQFCSSLFFFAKPSNFLMMAMIRVHKKLTKIHKNWHCAVSSLPFGELRTQKYELLVYLAADTFIWHGLGRENPLYYQSILHTRSTPYLRTSIFYGQRKKERI